MSLVRFVLEDGASVIANWDPAGLAGATQGGAAVVALTDEESVRQLPAGRVEAILAVDRGVPIPGDAAIFRFATLL